MQGATQTCFVREVYKPQGQFVANQPIVTIEAVTLIGSRFNALEAGPTKFLPASVNVA